MKKREDAQRAHESPVCESCGSARVAEFIYGHLPASPDELRLMFKRDIELGGTLTSESPAWLCRDCGARFGSDPDAFLTERDSRQLAENGRLLSSLYLRFARDEPRPRPEEEVFLRACLARAHYTFETILEVAEKRELDCVALVRSLYEHVVAFAWVAIDPARHFLMFKRWELTQREKMVVDLQKFGEVAPDLTQIRRALLDAAHESAPETADRALEADNYWTRLEPDKGFAFRRSYANIFRPNSAFVHPTLIGIDPFVVRDARGPYVVSHPMGRARLAVVTSAVVSFSDALWVASTRFGWPPRLDLAQVFVHGIDGKEDAK